MANMSYCRFQNTQRDFADCLGSLQEKSFSELSADEQRAAKRLYRDAKSYIEMYEDEMDEDNE